MYDRITDYNRDFELVPNLATEWEPNDDASAWTFDLREGVMFSTIDRELLAEDVRATAEVMASEDRVPGASADLGPLDQIVVEDDYRFTAELTRRDNAYPNRLAETGSWFNIVPANVINGRFEELGNTDFGSGPFTLTDFQESQEYVFEANDDWFLTDDDGNQLPYVDQVTAEIIPDPIAQANALSDERVDTLHPLRNNVFDRVDQSEGAEAVQFTTSSFLSMVMLTTLETESGDRPFADVRVRKAVKHAMDREEMTAAVNGSLQIGHHDPVAPVHPNYAPFDEGLEFGTTGQPDEARRLLDEAGYDDGLDLPELIYSADQTAQKEPIAQVWQEQMADVGIEFDIRRVTSDTWLSDHWNADDTWYISTWSARVVDTTVADLALRSDGPWNSARWANDDYDAALEAALNATSTDEIASSLAEAQRIHHLDGAWLVVSFLKVFSAKWDYVRSMEMMPSISRALYDTASLTGDAPEGP